MNHAKVTPQATRNSTTPAWLNIIAVVPALLLCVAVGLQPWIPADDLFRDPLAVAFDAAAKGECCHAYYGMLSLLSTLLWCAGASIALFTATVLVSRRNAPVAAKFFLSVGVLTTLLMVDDAFQGHEFFYPLLFRLPESATVGIYAAMLVTHLWFFRRHILALGPGLLVVSLLAFAVGVLTDLLATGGTLWARLGEDGTKLIGISAWTAFHWRAAWAHVVTEQAS